MKTRSALLVFREENWVVIGGEFHQRPGLLRCWWLAWKTVNQTLSLLVIWDTITAMAHHHDMGTFRLMCHRWIGSSRFRLVTGAYFLFFWQSDEDSKIQLSPPILLNYNTMIDSYKHVSDLYLNCVLHGTWWIFNQKLWEKYQWIWNNPDINGLGYTLQHHQYTK